MTPTSARRLELAEERVAELERRAKIAPKGKRLEMRERLRLARTAALKAAGRRA